KITPARRLASSQPRPAQRGGETDDSGKSRPSARRGGMKRLGQSRSARRFRGYSRVVVRASPVAASDCWGTPFDARRSDSTPAVSGGFARSLVVIRVISSPFLFGAANAVTRSTLPASSLRLPWRRSAGADGRSDETSGFFGEISGCRKKANRR